MSIYYAIKNGGNWSNIDTWALSSGQSVGGAGVPTILDDVYIDNTLLSTETVTVDVLDASCASLNCSGCIGTFTCISGFYLNVNGNVIGLLSTNGFWSINLTGSGKIVK